MPEAITKNGFPKKVFGELTLIGGLHNLKQTLKLKYLLPTKEYPTGKAVIEIIVPDSMNSFSIDKNRLKEMPELIEKLSYIIDKLEFSEDKQLIATQINFNKSLFEDAKNDTKPYVIKSFRFTENDYVQTQDLMSHLAKLFGYLFYKYKTEIEKEGSDEHLAGARDAVAVGISQKVHKNFAEGFMEGINEKIGQKLVARQEP